ncbi:MAG: DUF4263 domain-containing protein [Coriobacteriia bacterium]|nr:DUF4263 domain-containing protein [Coriobacteriia bacterium]
MGEIHTSPKGIEYADARTLKLKSRTETLAALRRIPHRDSDKQDLSLRLGRFNRVSGKPDVENPKSALSLDNEELEALIDYLSETYGPLRERAQRYIPLSQDLSEAEIDDLRSLFATSDMDSLIQLMTTHELMPAGLLDAVEMCHRRDAVTQFASMLEDDHVEHEWQRWFTNNPWVLGTEFVEVLDERAIDTANVTDYLMRAHDGFVDVVEIKRPGGGLKFWAVSQDHGNLYPHADLVKALTQAMNYLTQLELEANSVKFFERVGARVLKPRGTLVYGRSSGWGLREQKARRVLNTAFHNLSILTYDDVLERAKRMLGETPACVAALVEDSEDDGGELIPF